MADFNFDYMLESENAEEDEDIRQFIYSTKNPNTTKKTLSNINRFEKFLNERKENRAPELIPPAELDAFICKFIMQLKRGQDDDYEPGTIDGYFGSLEGYLLTAGYQCSITKDDAFKQSRDQRRYCCNSLEKEASRIKPIH